MFNLSNEDLAFLQDLQHEMLTQDHVGQAAPRFWVVAGTQKVYVGKEYAEGEALKDDEDIIADGIEDAVKYFKEEVLAELNEDDDEYEYILEKEETESFASWRVAKMDKNYSKDSDDYIEGNEIIMEQNYITGIEELIEALVDAGAIDEGDYDVVYYREEHYCYPNTMFLTNRSCKEHIEANKHHYSADAHSYAMTAWRSPEVEKLWTILEKIDWKAIQEAAHNEN